MNEEWLSLEDIADMLHLPLRTLYNRRSIGSGPRAYRIGKHVRVRRSDLDAWIESQADGARASR